MQLRSDRCRRVLEYGRKRLGNGRGTGWRSSGERICERGYCTASNVTFGVGFDDDNTKNYGTKLNIIQVNQSNSEIHLT